MGSLFTSISQRITTLSRSVLFTNALALYAVQGLNYLMPLLLLPFLLRALQPEGYGAIMFAQSLLGYAAIVVEFGFNFTAARDISVARNDLAKVTRIYWTTTAAKLVLLLVMICVVALIVLLVPKFRHDWPLYAASSLLLVGNVLFPQWYFQGLERLKEVALVQAVAKCVVTGLALLLVRTQDDLLLAALLLASPQVVASLAGWCLGKPLMPTQFYRPSWRDVTDSLRHSRELFVANIATTLYLNTNTFVLGLLSGEVAVALYSVATRIIATVQGLAAPMVQAIYPRASLLFSQDRDQAWRLVRTISLALFPGMFLLGVGMLIAAPTIVALLGGEEFSDSVPVLQIMAFVPLLVTIAMVLSQVIMVNIGLSSKLSKIYLQVGVINIIILPLLILSIDVRGAAVSLFLAELLGPIMMAAAIRKNV